MIPNKIVQYLNDNRIDYIRHPHPRAVAAQKLAQTLHLSGRHIGKSVVVTVDGEPTLCVIPAHYRLNVEKLTDVLDAQKVRLVEEEDFAPFFDECEVGAEPPFGKLFGMPVILDSSFGRDTRLMVRAGSHEETLEIGYDDFMKLEEPTVASIGERVVESVVWPREEGTPSIHA